MKTQRENMLEEKLYMVDGDLKESLYRARKILQKLNKAITREEIQEIARKLFAKFGSSSITPPFRCDYGSNIYIGDNSYFNYNTSLVDVAEIRIGDNVLVGPDCGFYTAEHPIDPYVRKVGVEFARKIIVEDDVWIGGHSVITSGVTIGKGSIIGAGSVVTKNIPSGVIAFGNPCKVYRKIDKKDRDYWMKKLNDFCDSYPDLVSE